MLIDKEKTYKNIVLYTCLVFFALSILIVPKYNIKGGVFIMLGTTAIMSCLTLYYYFKYRKINKI
jgi:O-antigen/teichoic acid export membrane protein